MPDLVVVPHSEALLADAQCSRRAVCVGSVVAVRVTGVRFGRVWSAWFGWFSGRRLRGLFAFCEPFIACCGFGRICLARFRRVVYRFRFFARVRRSWFLFLRHVLEISYSAIAHAKSSRTSTAIDHIVHLARWSILSRLAVAFWLPNLASSRYIV